MRIQKIGALFFMYIAFAPYALAQVDATLEPVSVEGSSSGSPGGTIYRNGVIGGGGSPCGRGTGNGGGSGGCNERGGGGDSGSKTPEQKRQEREKCENARNDARSELQTTYTAQMSVCASRNSTTFGYFAEQVKQFLGEAAGVGPGDCSANLTRQYSQLLTIYDKRRDACVAAANRG